MKFSIVTPSLNQLEWLRLCAASVADQASETLSVEHIVQDAGSGPALEAWARGQPPSLRLFIEKDSGMYDAVNRGLRRADGDVCAYLNCDEQYLPGALERVREFFAAHPAVEVLFADALLVDGEGCPRSYRRAVLPQPLHTRLAHLGTLTCATFFRRSLVERGLLFPTRWTVIGDGVWVLDLLAARVKMATLTLPLAAFTLTGDNLGQGLRADEEARRWRQSLGWRTALRPWIVFFHRLRKWRAGAYRRRSLTAGLYTRESPTARRRFEAHGLGWNWPGGKAAA